MDWKEYFNGVMGMKMLDRMDGSSNAKDDKLIELMQQQIEMNAKMLTALSLIIDKLDK